MLKKQYQRKDCSFHWDTIKSHLQGKKTIFNIGSGLGSLTVQIAQEFPDVVIGSFEKEKSYVLKQRKLLIQNDIRNVILCWYEFDSRVIEYLWKSHDAIDLILLLFNFHSYKDWEVESFLKEIKSLTPEIIIEFPRSKENILKRYFKEVELINEEYNIFRASNPEISRSADDRHQMSWNQKDGWKIDQEDREWIPGISLQNLAMWYIMYPSLGWFLKAANSAYLNLTEDNVLTDISMNNLLFTSDGLVAIDYLDKDTEKFYKKSFKDYSSGNWYEKGIESLEDEIRNSIRKR